MIITATQKNTRQTALKMRLVVNQVRKLPLTDAIKQLSVIQKRSSLTVLKVVRQAIANAMHNHGYSYEELILKNITVAPGQSYKRFRAVSRGRAHTIFKRTCHITVDLEAGSAPKVVKKETKPEVNAELKEVAPVVEKTAVAPQKVRKIAPTKIASQKVARGVRRTGEK